MAVKSKWKDIYEWFMMILVLLVLVLLFVEFRIELTPDTERRLQCIDTGILIIFVIDYFVRLLLADSKKMFIKGNIPDLIAIIPVSSLFRVVRLVRLTRLIRLARTMRLVRVVVWLTRFKDRFADFIRTNGMIYVVAITVAINLFGAIGIYFLENMDLVNAFWWSFVTITTVGYGDISPATTGGKLLAAVLMLVGIGFIGMLTGTIATYFLGEGSNKKESYKQQTINSIKEQIDNIDNLTHEDVENIISVLRALKNRAG
ncbi:voltage-gated potassium channel [Tindallia magadiensis]|uniref:Voltage-gated potassium channel n=1 Tax=Tindallia magadiensis TaxID=69895 RepID=A0A1I3AZX1_9FIRM|nr:potassium channel family protein [Tindallia magadiensis]SFH55617.1 voltage-gated potassium channel [Tindallia magadiensis]